MTCPAILLEPDSPECNLGFCSWPTSLLWLSHSFPNSICQAQLMGCREFWVGLSPGDALTHETSKVRCGDTFLESQHSGGGNKG